MPSDLSKEYFVEETLVMGDIMDGDSDGFKWRKKEPTRTSLDPRRAKNQPTVPTKHDTPSNTLPKCIVTCSHNKRKGRLKTGPKWGKIASLSRLLVSSLSAQLHSNPIQLDTVIVVIALEWEGNWHY